VGVAEVSLEMDFVVEPEEESLRDGDDATMGDKGGCILESGKSTCSGEAYSQVSFSLPDSLIVS